MDLQVDALGAFWPHGRVVLRIPEVEVEVEGSSSEKEPRDGMGRMGIVQMVLEKSSEH